MRLPRYRKHRTARCSIVHAHAAADAAGSKRTHSWNGMLWWVAFSIAIVFVRGVRWDEVLEFAQIASRRVPYPDGHPYLACVRNSLNLQIGGAAAFYAFAPHDALLCAVRNVLVIAATVLPAYALGAALSGRALGGHAAAILTSMGVHLEFDSCYPMTVWGRFFSMGHVGMGYALLTLTCWITGRLSAGALLLGLMPCIHVGQMPALVLLAAFRIGVAWMRGERRRAMLAIAWGALGVALCGLFLGIAACYRVPMPSAGAYCAGADPRPIFEGILESDPHRAAPGSNVSYASSDFALAAALLLSAGAARWRRRRDRSADAWGWTAAYVAIVAILVFGIMTLHGLLGSAIPYVLIAWMPYRLSNHAVIILLAALASMSARRSDAALLIAALSFPVMNPILGLVLPPALYARYIASGEGVLFALCGAMAALLAVRATTMAKNGNGHVSASHGLGQSPDPENLLEASHVQCAHGPSPTAWLAAWGILVALLAWQHQFGAGCCLLGALAAWIVSRARFRPPRWALGAAMLTALIVLVCAQGVHRQWLPLTPFEQAVRQRIDAHAMPATMVAGRPDQYGLQSKLHRPVLLDGALAPWIPYMRSLGPIIDRIHRDVYGIQLAPRDPSVPPPDPWTAIWQIRSTLAWQELGRLYGFRYVLAPAQIPLNLPIVLRGDADCLYVIPDDTETPLSSQRMNGPVARSQG